MGVSWGSSSQRHWLASCRATGQRFRHRSAPHLPAAPAQRPARRVEFSPLADELAALRGLHQIVPAVNGLPVDADRAAAGTLMSGPGRRRIALVPHGSAPLDRNERTGGCR